MIRHRSVVPEGVHVLGGWPVKTYTVGAERLGGAPDLWREQALVAATDVLAEQPRTEDEPLAGVLVLHHGMVGVWLLVDWWRGDILHQALFLGQEPHVGFGPAPQQVLACVFELVVIDHERRAWARHVLGGQPDLDAYLRDVVEVTAGSAYA